MKKLLPIVLVCLLLFICVGCNEQKETKVTELNTPAEKLGYALGTDIGNSFKSNEMSVDLQAFIQGFKDAMNGGQALLAADEIKVIQRQAIADMRKNMGERQKTAAVDNAKAGEKFFAENKGKEGIVTTASGLQYEVLTKGEGPVPVATDKVKVNYVGTLLDGTEFDSSYKRGKPAEFGITGVIAGWTEALQLMPVGSKWKLFIPGKLAYGPRGAGKLIGANASLIFEVELIEIVTSKVASSAKEKK